MNADFLDAHQRHLRDADYLLAASCLANADHLYGMAAECGLKRLMIAFGMKIDATGSPTNSKEDRVHADKVWARYDAYRSGHVAGVRFVLSSKNPFNDWRAEQRYANTHCFDLGRVDAHRIAAHDVHLLMKQAEMAGLV
jgi:hypothetical protein